LFKTLKNVQFHLILTLNTQETPFNSFYALNLAKTWLGDFLGDFSESLGDFFTKTSGHPEVQSFVESQCGQMLL
jgi:hypothetical protein